MTRKLGKRKQWTKDELKEFLKLWESRTVDGLAEYFNVKRAAVTSIAAAFRKEGMKLTYKRKNGSRRTLIRELLKEMKKR